MGLPFAAVAARVFEKLHDLFDDDEEPYDATASWRSFMADVFGKEMGEVASRGLPRAAGFDLSQRAGEQELFPFSEFLTDRRDWEESIADMTYRSAGAPVSMMTNIVKGGNKMMEGDILEGMQEAVPLAIKGGFKAYRMTEDGYVDSKGNKLPMEPGAWDVMVQILGFNPSEKAEYAEQKRDINERKGDLTRRANRISQHIQEALMSGDREAAQEYIQMGQKLAIATNGQYDPVSSAEAAIQRKMKGQVVAQITGTPVGVGAEDFQDQQLVDYANVDYRAAVR